MGRAGVQSVARSMDAALGSQRRGHALSTAGKGAPPTCAWGHRSCRVADVGGPAMYACYFALYMFCVEFGVYW